MKTAYIHTRIDPNLKNKGVEILSRLGISLSQFIEMSLKKVIKEKKIEVTYNLLDEDVPENYIEVENIKHLRKLINYTPNEAKVTSQSSKTIK